MAVQIGAKPDSGFDDPLGMLKDCHRRIERFVQLLCRVVELAADRALTAEERDTVKAALRYFREGGVRHNADEEESLFPRMRAACGDAAMRDLDALEGEHALAGELHTKVDELYCKWIATGTLHQAEQLQLLTTTAKLKRLYTKHIQVEETTVLPQAAQILDRAELAAAGAEFKARRQ
ncbi:MAG TPA: hemerythrin domain-containing protein [Acidobacteriaceae bacterium]|nr:hemerythrin domain-containing protein [Acidobacteriaceae bacterium]